MNRGFCIDCEEPVVMVELYIEGREAMFCNNPGCHRFGLFTAVTLPEKSEKTKKDKKDSDKGV